MRVLKDPIESADIFSLGSYHITEVVAHIQEWLALNQRVTIDHIVIYHQDNYYSAVVVYRS